jgi:cell wall-associated NlpC family hydrolase
METETAGPPGNDSIVAAAKSVWDAAKGNPYTWGGHDTSGFDCSGFVCYVLRQAFPTRAFAFVTAGQLFTDPRFDDVKGDPQFGDLICFKSQKGLTHDHIGIVFDARNWIGSQSSTGVAPVLFSNIWWSPKAHWFRRLKG